MSASLSFSGLEMSGFGATLLTDTPTPESAKVAAEGAAILPLVTRPSTPPRMATRTSGVSPSATRLASAPSKTPRDVELVTARLLELWLQFLEHGPHSDRGVHLDIGRIRGRAEKQQRSEGTGQQVARICHRILPGSMIDPIRRAKPVVRNAGRDAVVARGTRACAGISGRRAYDAFGGAAG